MRSNFSLLHLLVFIFALAFLMGIVQVGIINLMFQKLGLSPVSAMLLLSASLFGSFINIPLFIIESEMPQQNIDPLVNRFLHRASLEFTGKTIIAANFGGCIVPVLFSSYLFLNKPLGLTQMLLGISFVTFVSYIFSRPVPGIGIGMPILIAPLAAASIAILIGEEHRASLAYISGTLGVLIGADILHLRDIGKMGSPLASIGGAGTFDGIFITGIVAVLLT